jgi:hypothetical protein
VLAAGRQIFERQSPSEQFGEEMRKLWWQPSAAQGKLGRSWRRRRQQRQSGRSTCARLGIESLEPRLVMAGVVINEILASNSGQFIQDEDGDDSDYIELYNSNSTPVDLGGWYLTDNASDLTGWQLPAESLAPGAYLVIFASNKDRAVAGNELHTNFALSAAGEYIALVQADGVTIESDFTFPAQFVDASYGLAGQELRYFDPPTPGGANGQGLLGFVADLQASHSHGYFDSAFLLTLQTSTAGSEIYYTYDGSIPTPDNPSAALYDGAIEVDRTTVLRASAHQDGYGASPVMTQTYVFVEDVLTQTIDPNNPANNPFGQDYSAEWQGYAGDFNMDAEVVGEWDDHNPLNTDFGIREGMASLPTMSIVMDHDDLWDQTNGIYPNADERSVEWRRAGSIEFFDPATGENFQANVGVEMQGNSSRNPARTKKHSFRLIFSPVWDGPERLEFPLFDQSNFADINTIILKGGNQDSFPTRTTTDRFSPLISTNMRDQWMMNTARDMGQLATEFSYVHLYINGLYWGVYTATERIDDAMLSGRLGGDESDWDIIEPNGEITGSDAVWNELVALARTIPTNNTTTANAIFYQLQGLNPDGTSNESMPVYLDMDSLIDYLLVHYYAEAHEWVLINYAYVRNRVDPGTGFKFVLWDQDVLLNNVGDGRIGNTVPGFSVAQELGHLLRRSPEYKLLFADRVQMQLYNGGALSDEQSSQRWQELAAQIEKAMIVESARWGDTREGENVRVYSGDPVVTVPTITVDTWRNSVATVDDRFPQQRTDLLPRLLSFGLYPSLGAPQPNQFGGTVANGFQLELQKPAGSPETATIYYTLDGSDPRAIGGGLSASAVSYSGPVTLTDEVQLRARILNGTTWSAEISPSFDVLPPRLPGDYDGNGAVQTLDYDVWRGAFGTIVSPGISADGNADGSVDVADYVMWQKLFVPGPVGPDTDYDFDALGQTYKQNFNDFGGTVETLPQYFTGTILAGTDVWRGVFDSTAHAASAFTGIKAATSDGTNYSLAWRESTGPANLEDARFLFKIKNDTGEPITGFQVSYDVETWVNGRRDNQVRFKYDVYADSSESQAAEGRDAFESDIFATVNPNHTPIATNGDQFVLDGTDPANRVTVSGYVDLTTLLISDAVPGLGYFGALAPGETAYFRWQVSNATLTDGNRSALGIDNISITALAGPPGGGGVVNSISGLNPDSLGNRESAKPANRNLLPAGAIDLALENWSRPLANTHSNRMGGFTGSSSRRDFASLLLAATTIGAGDDETSSDVWGSELDQRDNASAALAHERVGEDIDQVALDWNLL